MEGAVGGGARLEKYVLGGTCVESILPPIPSPTTARLPLSEWYNHPSSCLARTSKARCRWTETSGTYTRMNLPFSHLRCSAAVAKGRCTLTPCQLSRVSPHPWVWSRVVLEGGVSRAKLSLVRSRGWGHDTLISALVRGGEHQNATHANAAREKAESTARESLIWTWSLLQLNPRLPTSTW